MRRRDLIVLLFLLCFVVGCESSTKLGVVSDLHGEVDRVKQYATYFESMGVDAILVPGDIVNNEDFSGRGIAWDDSEEIVAVLAPLLETGIEVYVIPGNHETQEEYMKAVELLSEEYENLIDMSVRRVVEVNGIHLLGIAGYTDERFTAAGGFVANEEYVLGSARLVRDVEGPVLLVVHGAPFVEGVVGPASTSSGLNVGDRATAELMREAGIDFAVVGNIHEAAGTGVRLDGRSVEAGEWSRGLVVNAGTLVDWQHLNGTQMRGNGLVLEFRGEEVRFEVVRLD